MKLYLIILFIFFIPTQGVGAQSLTPETLALRMLAKIPDIPATRHAFGRGDEERELRASQHASAIFLAARTYKTQWEDIAHRGEWESFNANTDLAPLLAAIAYNESRFMPVIRRDDNTRGYSLPPNARVRVLPRRRRRSPPISFRADIGVMQVRAPSGAARRCGVSTYTDVYNLLHNLEFSYNVGACVLTSSVANHVEGYKNRNTRRLAYGQRPPGELTFFGLWGARRNTARAALAQELLVIERYNWGNAHLYQHPRGAGYSRRILRVFEQFKHGRDQDNNAMPSL